MIQTAEHIDKREVILMVAEKLFAEQDFDAVSVRDIAKGANVNVAMISYYFGSKEKMFKELISRRIITALTSLMEVIDAEVTSYEKMQTIIDYYVDKLVNNRHVHKMINRELSSNNRPHLREFIMSKMRINREYIKSIIEEGIRRNEFKPDIDIDMAIMNFFGCMNQVVGASYYSCDMFNKATEEELFTPEFAERIKTYFKETFKHNLIINR